MARVALVTGGTRGIGHAACVALKEAGYTVAANYAGNDEAAAKFTRYTENKPDNAWGQYMLGLAAWKAGDAERSEAAFRKALEIDPKHVTSWVNLSRVYLDVGQPDSALDCLDQARALDATAAEVDRLLGRARAEDNVDVMSLHPHVAPPTGTQAEYWQELVARAAEKRLWEQRFWHLLLHYRPDLLGSGYTSEADGPGFFLAEDGKTVAF